MYVRYGEKLSLDPLYPIKPRKVFVDLDSNLAFGYLKIIFLSPVWLLSISKLTFSPKIVF